MDYVGIRASDLFSDKRLYCILVILDDEPKRSVRSKYLRRALRDPELRL